MNLDELERKIIEVKKRGLNILVENELIADLRGQYYNKLIDRKLKRISDQVRRNIYFMNSIHKDNISYSKIREFMGVEAENNINKIAYEDTNLTSLKSAILISEYYGIPVEIFLFQDLEANVKTFKQLYPTFFRQSRD